jgi:hypothetical protein
MSENSEMIVYCGNPKDIQKIKTMAERHAGLKPSYEGKGSDVKKLR